MPSARFPHLYQAVRAGIQIAPDPAPPGRFLGVSPLTGRLGCDALAGAWLAEFYDRERTEEHDATLAQFFSADLAGLYEVLTFDMGPSCPAGPTTSCPHSTKIRPSLEQKIIHLQDCHGFTREKVADWLESHGL